MIQTCASWGLDGIETHTPVHTQAEITYYEELARRFNLLATSGSDCHGDDPYLGPALMGTTATCIRTSIRRCWKHWRGDNVMAELTAARVHLLETPPGSGNGAGP